MDRYRSRLLETPKRVVVTVAYRVVALVVAIAGWISLRWYHITHDMTSSILEIFKRRKGRSPHEYPKGRRPKTPRVLGVVLFQRSFRAQEDQALARLVVWAAQQGFLLCTLYCPYDGVHVQMDRIKESMKWSDVPKVDNVTWERSIQVWEGWDAPHDWIDALKILDIDGSESVVDQSISHIPLGVALLRNDHAEAPLTAILPGPEDAMTDGRVDHDAAERDIVLERALRAPMHIKQIFREVAGPVATMDPDIIMIFGGISSLGGYPSWSTRSSEIYDMGPLGVVTRGKLDAALKRYKVTKQRFGR